MRQTLRAFMPLCFGLSLATSACAQQPGASAAAAKPASTAVPKPAAGVEAKVRQAIAELAPQAQVDYFAAGPLAGFNTVIVGGQVFYVTDDGRYLMQGRLVDLKDKQDLSDQALATLRRSLLAKIPVKDRIVFAPANPKYTVAVFTDVECGFCRELHSQVAEYNREGIAIEYLAFPRAGINTPDYDKMVAVWCAADRKKALTDAKSDRPPPPAPAGCVSPVKDEYITGLRAGLNGTPMILTEDGTQLGGYLPPKQLREALDAWTKDRAKAAPAG
jgi:thiol:disulfide interchange protein DsbC